MRAAATTATTAALAVLSLAALTGCGAATTSSGSFRGDAHAVAQTIGALSSAASSRDTSKICDTLLAPALVTKIRATGGGDCPKAIGHQLDDTDNFDLKTQTIQVSGTSATARVKSTHGGHSRQDTLALIKQGSTWRISGLG